MSDAETTGEAPVQTAEASGHARVTQVGGNYEEHIHRYVRGWQYLRDTTVDTAELDLAEHAFVDPVGPQGTGQAEQAVNSLTRPYGSHVVVLCGQTGSGRRTAALHVLRRAGVPRERIRWLSLDWDQPRTEQIPSTKGHGFILDLTGGQELKEDFYTGLADYQKQAEAAEAFLIILADAGCWNPGVLATVPVVHLTRPSAKLVAEEHLRRISINRLDWLASPPLDTLLAAGASPADAARLARLIAEADEGGREAVKKEFTDWHEHLADWFRKHSGPDDVRERALLISAALLERVPADVVLEAADRLFTEVGGVLPPGGSLAGRDLQERRQEIHASLVDGESISLEANGHGLPEAVLKYVWQQRPQLRGNLLEWASQISAPGGPAVRHLGRIADCLVQLSLLPGGSTVRSVAIAWIDTGRSAHRQLAIGVLETMALHPETGVDVRKLLYHWAQQKTASKELVTAVAQICAGRLGKEYPRVALTRLRLLASRADGLARDAVADAVRALAEDPDQRILVLSEIVQWAESTNSTVAKAGAGTFLALTDISSDAPPPLTTVQEFTEDAGGELVTNLFVRGWRAALREPEASESARDQLGAWLDSPRLSDEQVLPLAAAVLRGRLREAAAAELLVGSPGSTDLGRQRRKKLLEQLISERLAPSAAPVSAAGSDLGLTAA